ncbi:MAG TPA: o-succinylbenzoate synthase [Deltaproteobacteria bacterium]|jgi:O-succinylbenzoate synthase|nr:o-succinylbenzoate synthase [SAR324 cluster bacterium]MCH2265784.1 o-succinylbenzoate synthase [SAR324 cluster bacterium]HIN46910.1 o-succinylbenzoate synthase [Deltaproteobacteria bacterium]
MKSCRWELFRYSLPLKEPLRMLGNESKERNGLILRLSEESAENSKAENFGEGEIAPLPGLHPESLSEAESQIREYFSGNFNPTPRSDTLFPSVRFGLDMALRTMLQSCKVSELNSFKETAGKDYRHSKSDLAVQQIPVNGLLTASGNKLEQECEQLRNTGFKAIKIKVGRLSVQDDIERVKLARKILADDISLRLDANRSWDWKEALQFAKAIKDCRIEYCEEPLRDFQRMEELHEQTGIPLALDETLWNNPNPETLAKNGIRALILKPGILGGWESTKFWVDFAEKQEMKVVISSSFESGLGLNWLAFMAANLLKQQIPAGLDTAKWFKQDLIDPPFTLTNGNYVFPESWPRANLKHLQKIADGSWIVRIADV